MKDRRAEAERWLDRMMEEHPPEFFHALHDLIEERFRRGRGKPKGTGGVDDSARLERMVELLRSGEATDEEKALLRVAREDPGKNEKNTRKRLRQKLPQVRAKLADPEEREKAEILRRAFAENPEQWDL
jgi:hypothetical protein